jgi:hypothetical protein
MLKEWTEPIFLNKLRLPSFTVRKVWDGKRGDGDKKKKVVYFQVILSVIISDHTHAHTDITVIS